MNNKKIAVIGCGIKTLAHLTREAISYIENADYLLYLVNEPAMKDWLSQCNVPHESLEALYYSSDNRADNYSHIASHILMKLESYRNIAFVIYGHPTIYAQPVTALISQADPETTSVLLIPGISAENTLFTDLQIDPGPNGWQCYEATDFIIRKRNYDPSTHLILWQAGVIGVTSPTSGRRKQTHQMNILSTLLIKKYPENHEIILYEAAVHIGMSPLIHKTTIKSLQDESLSPITTIYVPPLSLPAIDRAIANQLHQSQY